MAIQSILQRVIVLVAVMSAGLATSISSAQPVTIVIAHGFTTGSKGAWVQGMAEAIIARAGQGSVYRYTGATGVWTYVPDAGGDHTNNVVVLIFNWVPESASVSAGPNWNYAQAAADVLYALLRDPKYAGQNGPSNLLSNRSVQFLGHSRGACVISEAVRRLALANISIDQFSTFDPHPVNGTLDAPYNFNWGDPVPQKWNNVTWADNCWRADGGGLINGLNFDGIPITNATNTQLNESVLNSGGYSQSHSDTHLWYHGTIDTSATANDGEQAITPAMRNTWWPPPEGSALRGYYFAALGGGATLRPAQPAGTAAGSIPVLYNGDFEQGTYAGWSYHGGSVNGQIIVESGNGYLKLGAGAGGASATHNRFFLPAAASAIVFDERIQTAAANESLRVSLNDAGGASVVLGSTPLTPVGGWVTNMSIPIMCAAPRSRDYTLSFQIIASGAATSVVNIDNVRITTAPLPGDVTGDGFVNVDDLLLVINSWGACPQPCPPAGGCAADVNGNCFVNVDDLLAVINSWGTCP